MLTNRLRTKPLLWLLWIALIYEVSAQDIPEQSQISQITIDLDKGTISSGFPFDRFFKINIKGTKLLLEETVSIYQMEYKDGVRFPSIFKTEIRQSRRKNRNTRKKAVPDGKTFLRLNLRQRKDSVYETIVPPLSPNEMYEIVLKRNLSDAQISTLFIIMNKVTSDPGKALELYNEKIKGSDKGQSREIAIQHLPAYEGFIEKHYPKLKDLLVSNSSPLVQFSKTVPDVDLRKIATALTKAKLEYDNFTKLSFELINPKISIKDAVIGVRKFGSSKKIEFYKYDQRLKILEFNLKVLDSTEFQLKKLQLLDSDQVFKDFYDKDFSNLVLTIKSNLKTLTKIYKHFSAYTKRNLSYGELVSANTTTTDVKTRNAQYLVTDFGFTNAIAHNNNGEWKYIGRPHVGVNWHFGGVDKDQKLNHIVNKRLWHRLSLAFGVTVGKIDEGNFEDLFNGLSPTVGLNYRITQQVRLGIGGLVLREKDSNPILDRSPVLVAPYASITFDFSLFGQLGSLATKIIN